MKKLIILFVFALVSGLNFTSCSSDDDDDSSSSSSIIGKWNFSKVSTTINGVTTPEIDFEGNESGCPKDFIEFKTGGILIEGDYSESTCDFTSIPCTWVQSGSTITITEADFVFTAEIISLSSTVLKVKATSIENGVTNIENVTFTKA
jgi:hypothetical protein